MQKIALVGNPNAGKTTLFNALTGLNQKVGNYPGITVEKKSAKIDVGNEKVQLYDFPGIYSIYPNSEDESLVSNILLNPEHPDHPNKVILVSDSNSLERSVALTEQMLGLGFEVYLAINRMQRDAKEKRIPAYSKIADYLGCEVNGIEALNTSSLNDLKDWISTENQQRVKKKLFTVPITYKKAVNAVKERFKIANDFLAWSYLAFERTPFLGAQKQEEIQTIKKEFTITPKRLRVKEVLDRNKVWKEKKQDWLPQAKAQVSQSERIDKVLLHPIFGYIIFFGILLFVFQSIFTWAEKPMDWIEQGFTLIGTGLENMLPQGPLNEILTQGIIPGLGGIFVFVPQIMILFFFISIMEGSGYMSRVVFLMDRWMRPFGLSGKSVVPFISGVACAIPAIMSARTIENHKERLITILVTPFMTCAARLPIYSVITALVIPEGSFIGKEYRWFFLGITYKGLALFGLYALGVIAALASSYFLRKCIKNNFKSFLILEMPNYSIPIWKNVGITIIQKTWSFVWGAGKIIMAVSIILWALSSVQNPFKSETDLANNTELENSVLGGIGMAIEPVIAPLGYDWKMGIGLLSSFAAREVFVGTMATIYSISEDDTENDEVLTQKLSKEKNSRTGGIAYDLPTGMSLLIFYAFAMQCMGTLAIVKKETNSWKWPLLQLFVMGAIAYIAAYLTFNLFSL